MSVGRLDWVGPGREEGLDGGGDAEKGSLIYNEGAID